MVKSTELAIMQHEGFSWVVERDAFVLVEDVGQFSKNFGVTLRAWLSDMDSKERKAVVDAFFDLFVQAGISDFTEIVDMDVRMAGKLLKAVAKVPHAQREQVGKLIKLLVEENTKK